MRRILPETKTLICAWMLLCMIGFALGFTPTLQAQSLNPYVMPTSGEFDLSNKNWAKTVSEIYNIPNPPPAFDPNRTAEDYLNNCATWAEPSPPDAQSQEWYRAATTLQLMRHKSVQEYHQMLQLYEAAARRGHYKAIKQLIITYSEKDWVFKGHVPPQQDKARYWLNYGLQQGWTGSLEWLAYALLEGASEFPHNPALGMAYLQQASDMGVPLAQWQLSLEFRRSSDVAKEKALLECASRQGLHAALDTFAYYIVIDGDPKRAAQLNQLAVMAGGDAGGSAAFAFSGLFLGDEYSQKEWGLVSDPVRGQAYREIDNFFRDGEGRMKGNIFVSLPRLNEVLPLPPAKVTEWKGIYSAMSESDAEYYQNPPPAEFYLKQVEQAGVLVPVDYLSQPVMDKK